MHQRKVTSRCNQSWRTQSFAAGAGLHWMNDMAVKIRQLILAGSALLTQQPSPLTCPRQAKEPAGMPCVASLRTSAGSKWLHMPSSFRCTERNTRSLCSSTCSRGTCPMTAPNTPLATLGPQRSDQKGQKQASTFVWFWPGCANGNPAAEYEKSKATGGYCSGSQLYEFLNPNGAAEAHIALEAP